MKKRILSVLLTISILLGAVALSDSGIIIKAEAASFSGIRTSVTPFWNDFEWEVLRLTNAERARTGAIPLSMFEKLHQAANIRNNELPALFSHDRPDGRDWYTVLFELTIPFNSAGENLAAGQTTPAAAVNAWMNSTTGHREAILDTGFNHLGTAHFSRTGTVYRNYWTQLFLGGCQITHIEVGFVSPNPVFTSGRSIEELGLLVMLSCIHGTSYIPLTSAMCSGYNSNSQTAQTVTVRYGTLITSFSIALTPTITFNANGGTVSTSSAATGADGRLANLPIPTRAGHTFTGWFTTQTGGTQVTTNTVFTANTTVFAQWSPNSYVVTFNTNEGTRTGGGQLTQTIIYGNAAVAPVLSREGHTFNGWDRAFDFVSSNMTVTARWTINNYTVTFDYAGGMNRAGGGRIQSVRHGGAAVEPVLTRIGYTFDGWDRAFNNVTQDITVTARWTLNRYTVTFDVNGGSALSAANRTRTRDHNATVGTLPTPTRTGHTFAGWFTARTGGTRITSTTQITANTTFFARWTLNRYTVTFDVNGGSALSAANRTRTRDHNATVGSLPTPTRANHTLVGWFTTRTGGTRITTTQRITANTTYFARWAANPARPANPRATANSRTEITVSWNRVTGATGYEVWRSTTANGTFTRVRDVTSGSTLSWRNTGLVADRQYFYRVRAYTTVNGVKAFSPYTATFNARTRR
jgi:uncharacterized repeat protein (TIGR02543 family)